MDMLRSISKQSGESNGFNPCIVRPEEEKKGYAGKD